MLPDTNYYYGLIVFSPADVFVPVLTTYDKKGNIISDESLSIGDCNGGGPGINYCSAIGVINSDLTIYCADTLKTVDLDKTMKAIDGTKKYYCKFKKGKINKDGKIIMISEQKKSLK